MSFFDEDEDYEGKLNDSALSRKIAQDLENCEFEDNGSIANIDCGSIYFDKYILKQENQIKKDQEEFDSANKKFMEYLKNNKGGQEIFDEIDRDLQNTKKMTRVKVKKETNDINNEENQQNENCQTEQNDESFVEIEDVFGDKEKYYPDEISESQYKEIKEKAKREAQELSKQMVFAEERIKREFMEQQGLMSDENSVISEDQDEDFKEDLNDLNDYKNQSILLKDAQNKVNFNCSLVENRNESSILTPKKKQRKGFNSENKQINGLSTKRSQPHLEGIRRSVGKSTSKLQGMGLRMSQSNYDLIMSGHMPLPSQVSRSIVAKQRSEQRFELKNEKITQDREMFDMENEDLLSIEYEEFLQRKSFVLKDFKIPDLPSCREQATPSTKDVYFDASSLSALNIPSFQPLCPNDEGNLLTRNSKEVCLEDACRPSNRRRLQITEPLKPAQSKTIQKAQASNQDGGWLKLERNIVQQPQDNIIKIQIQKEVLPVQNKQKEAKIFESVADILYFKMRAAQENLLNSYIKKGIVSELEKIFNQHQPKLIHQFFDQDQENIMQEEDTFEESQSSNPKQQKNSLKQFLSTDIFQNFQKKRRLELKLEGIGDIDGIDKLPKLEILSLSVNRIDKLDTLSLLRESKIVELNLAQNLISDYSPINQLRELRFLNLEMNKIQKMVDLSNCKQLEVLNLNTNRITQIENLHNNKQLRKLYLFKNSIERIGTSLNHNLFLEELDLGRNQLASLEGLENNILLKKLVVYYNKLQKLPILNFSFVFLVELYLNGNKLESIDGLQYLPCLEYLNISHNEIEKISVVPMLPNLITLIASFNKVSNFESIFNIARASPNIKYISFSDNEFVKFNISEDLRDLYDYLFLRNLPRLFEINHQEVDIGRKKYLEMRFNSIIKARSSPHEHAQLQALLGEFSIITRQHAFLNQQKKSRSSNLFAQNIAFYKLDSSFTCLHLFSMLQRIQERVEDSGMGNIRPSSSKGKQEKVKTKHNIRELTNSVFFEKDYFDHKHKKSLQKIASLFFKVIFKIRKKQKYLTSRLKEIISIQKYWRGNKVRKIVNFPQIFNSRKRERAAIKIQKVFRGFKLRKKKKNLFGAIKFSDDEELPEFDDSWINKGPNDYDTGLKMPDNFDVMSFINPQNTNYQNPYQDAVIQPLAVSQAPVAQIIPQTTIENHHQLQAPHKNTLLPPLQNVNGKQPLQAFGQNAKNNNFVNSNPHTNLNPLKPPSPAIKKKILQKPNSLTGNSMQSTETSSLLITQKARLHSKQDSDTQSNTQSHSSKDDILSSSNASIKSENYKAQGRAGSLISPSQTSQMFHSNSQRPSIQKNLAPVKHTKVSEEEKQKIMEEWGFTKPEVLQTFAYRLEKQRNRKVKQQPLNAEQRLEKFYSSKPKN